MRNFLNLPREIRNLIYHVVLTTEHAPPTSPHVTRGERELSRKQGNLTHHNDGIYYSFHPFLSAASGISLLCRQVYAEVQDTIALLPLRYKIDCMIDHELFVYPTWLSIPYPSSRIDTVDVDIRHFGATLSEEPGRRFSSDYVKYISRRLCEVLRRFLVRGPDFLAPVKGLALKLETRVININIVPTSERDDVKVESLGDLRDHHRRACNVHDLPSPNSIADEINRKLRSSMGYLTSRTKLIIRRVDHILVSVDGELEESWDLIGPKER